MKTQFSHNRLFILGNGGFAKELKNYFTSTNSFWTHITLIGQEDMPDYQRQTSMLGNYRTILGSGKCDIKARMEKSIIGDIASFYHPKSIICTNENYIGDGTVIAPGAVIAPNVRIGKHVLINYNATIGHDTIIGDLSVVSPNAAVGGNCKIGKQVYIGAGATIKEGTTIPDKTTIGMGAALIEDIVGCNQTLVGVPAKII